MNTVIKLWFCVSAGAGLMLVPFSRYLPLEVISITNPLLFKVGVIDNGTRAKPFTLRAMIGLVGSEPYAT